MTKYIYKGQEISHTRFLTICQMAGVMGGRKKSHYEKLVEMAEQGNERAQDILSDIEVVESKRGGYRPGAGRPVTERNVPLMVRISKEAAEKLDRLTDNKSEYLDNIIKQQPE